MRSHYARIEARNAAITGHQRNAAVPGSKMAALASQVASGTTGGFAPEYVTVMLGAGDICFGFTSVDTFRAGFVAGLDALAAASPSARVVVASVWNFESLRRAVLTRDPSASWPLCGDVLNKDAPVSEAVMTRIAEYNAVLASECPSATHPSCRFDRNALFDHRWVSDEVSTVDNLHPSVVGQAMLSRVLWDAGFWGCAAPPPDAPARSVARGTGLARSDCRA